MTTTFDGFTEAIEFRTIVHEDLSGARAATVDEARMIFAITKDRVLWANERRECSDVCSKAGRKQQRRFCRFKFRDCFFETDMMRRPPRNQRTCTSTNLPGGNICERGDNVRMARQSKIVVCCETYAALTIDDAFRRADDRDTSPHPPAMNGFKLQQ